MLAIGRALVTNPEAADHGRAVRGPRPDDHRGADRDLPAGSRRRDSRILLIEQNLGVATAIAERQLVMVGGEHRRRDDGRAARRRPRAAAPLPRRRAARPLGCRAAVRSLARACSPCSPLPSRRSRAAAAAAQGAPDLAFVSTRDGDYAIFAMDADGERRASADRAEDVDASTRRRPLLPDRARLVARTARRSRSRASRRGRSTST